MKREDILKQEKIITAMLNKCHKGISKKLLHRIILQWSVIPAQRALDKLDAEEKNVSNK